jgi:hypothetical protein
MIPHLAQFNLTGAFDDGIAVGRGKLGSRDIFIAAQEGRFLGGGHLSKVLTPAAVRGHHTLSLLYGGAEGGAFIATALSTQIVAAFQCASPSVADLPSIARVTSIGADRRDQLGLERKGRLKAAAVAERVAREAAGHV